MLQVSADGGLATNAAVLDFDAGDTTYRWPTFLPDGVHFLYHAVGTNEARTGIFVGSTVHPAPAGRRLFQSWYTEVRRKPSFSSTRTDTTLTSSTPATIVPNPA